MNNILFIIDCDNFSYNNYNNAIKKISNEVEFVSFKVVLFGNLNSKLKHKWIKVVNDSKLKDIVFANIPILKKKNITDHFIIVETMEMLFNENHDIFVFASDDVDFIPLYQKIKKYNKQIWQVSQNRELNSLTDGFLDKKINIFLNPNEDFYSDEELILLINESISENIKENGVCYLGDVKYWLDNKKDFNLERTKFKKFSRLVKSLKVYIVNIDEIEATLNKA